MIRQLVWVVLVLAGCADAERRPDSSVAGRKGQRYAIVVDGDGANDEKRARCDLEIGAVGGIADLSQPVRAVLRVGDGPNRLQVISRARGIVRNDDLPGWDMGRLCREAIAALDLAIPQEPQGYAAPAPQPYGQPQYQQPQPYQEPTLLSAPGDLAARGLASYARRDYGNALVAFAEANRLHPSPPLLFNLAVCYKLLNRPREAIQHMQLYVDRAPNAPNRAQADALLAELHRLLGNE